MSRLQSMCTEAVATVRPSDTIEHATELMEQHRIGAVVVAEQNRPVGIVTDRDVALALAVGGSTREEHSRTS